MDAEALRKAAILINALDTRSADALLDQMPDEQATAVRNAVMDLDYVPAEEQEEVIHSFLASQGRPSPPVRLERSVETPDPPQAVTEKPEPSPAASRPFEFLHGVDADALYAFLHLEHPQTMALVLAHLPPQQAADFVRRLPESSQTDVLGRVARLEQLNQEIIRDIEDQIANVYSARIPASQPAAGLASLRAILAASGGRERQEWVDRLGRQSPDIVRQFAAHDLDRLPTQAGNRNPPDRDNPQASDIAPVPPSVEAQPTSPPPFAKSPIMQTAPTAVSDSTEVEYETGQSQLEPLSESPPSREEPRIAFEQLSALNDNDLALVLKSAPAQVALVALTGAKPSFVKRLFQQLPPKDARSLNKKMEQIGPLQLRDVEFAQRRLASIAVRLADEGRIELPIPPARFAAAA